MPFDPTVGFIIGVAFLSLIAILIYSSWYQTFKYKHKNAEAGSGEDSASSVSIGELEAMMRKVVGEATKSLETRLTALEDEVGPTTENSESDDPRMLAEHRAILQATDAETHQPETVADKRRS